MIGVAEVEQEYDRLLREHQSEARDYTHEWRDRLRHQRIHAAGFQLPLRPFLMSREQVQHLERCLFTFWGALLKVFFTEFGGDVRRIAGLLKLEESTQEILERYFKPERAAAQLFGRADGFGWDATVQFIEQNITSGPGGLPGMDILSRFFDDFPVMRALRQQQPVTRLSPIDAYVDLFTSAPFAGKTVAYLDAISPRGFVWDDEGMRFVAALARRGVHLVNLTGCEFALRDDGFYADGRRIDCVYRGVAALGIWFRTERLRPIYEAVARGQCEMIISPFEMVFFDKMLLPYLSDERLGAALDHDQRRLLAEIVPWTRFLRDQVVSFHGRELPTPALCLEEKDRLVIKRGNGFSSEAVIMGIECAADAWKEHVDKALGEGNWIIQEMVDPPRRPLPYFIGDDVEWVEAMTMTCPYAVRGRLAGMAGRTSVPNGSRILVGAGVEGGRAGIRTTFQVA